MAVKITVGVILLRTAWRYYDNNSRAKKHEEENTDPPILRKRPRDSSLFDESETTKSKPLSDIERFTLCSNRII